MDTPELVALVGVATALLGAVTGSAAAWSALSKTRDEARKLRAEADKLLAEAKKARAEASHADAQADHTAVDAATDSVALLKTVYERCLAQLEKKYEDRISRLEDEVARLQKRVNDDRTTIVTLNQRLSEVMRGAEIQGVMIAALRSEIAQWKERVRELVGLLEKHQVPLPAWVKEKNENDQLAGKPKF